MACSLTASCKKKPQKYTTTVEVKQVRQFGQQQKLTDLEVKYVDCPGNARKVMRIDKSFSDCGAKLKVGDKLTAEVTVTYNPERGTYREQIVRLNECDVKTDPKDEANYTMVENCKDLEFTGMSVGVRCERGRTKELAAKCPWMRRN